MAATQQSAGVNGANTAFQIAQQMIALRAALNDYVTHYQKNNWGALWAAWPTAVLNADGSLGAADGAANNAHPVDTRLIGGLQADRSANDMTNLVALFQAFQAFLTNAAVATADRNAVLDVFQQG